MAGWVVLGINLEISSNNSNSNNNNKVTSQPNHSRLRRLLSNKVFTDVTMGIMIGETISINISMALFINLTSNKDKNLFSHIRIRQHSKRHHHHHLQQQHLQSKITSFNYYYHQLYMRVVFFLPKKERERNFFKFLK